MRPEWKRFAMLAGLCSVVVLSGCKLSATADEANDELAQVAGDALDGLDEATVNSFTGGPGRTDDESASRVACDDVLFGACMDNVRTRTFGNCTLGTLTFAGTTTLTWADAAVDNTCQVGAEGHSLARKPNWTVTGSRGWSIAVSTSGTYGQKVTWASETEAVFTSDGIRRTATTKDGEVIADFTTKTTTGLSITIPTVPPERDLRNGRVVDGGTLEITNNLNSNVCTVTPDALTWDNTCTCPVSGKLGGSCTDGTSYALTVSGCGTGSITAGGVTTSVKLGRCTAVAPPPM